MSEYFSKGSADPGSLVAENLHAISQLVELLIRLPPPLYRERFGVKKQHVIGKHVRHIIDHYTALLTALYEKPEAPLNYENREREALLELDARAACQRLLAIRESVASIHPDLQSRLLAMEHGSDDGKSPVTTSVGRELVFLSSHSIHHMAIIGMLVEQAGIEVSDEFGVHPSTLRHQQRLQTSLAQSA
ncbi:DinB family protein [Marinobacter sp.]|uniref:DinB family protein n=1 Tax=Marinobacter sp. TaxID=50741 RepID=UPI00384C9F30